MKLELVDQARKIALQSWAARLGLLAAVLQALAEFQDQLPLLRDYVPHNVFSLLAILCAVAVPLARIVKQDALSQGQTVPDVSADTVADVAQAIKVVLNAHTAPPPAPVVRPEVVIERRPAPASLK